jgi:hypothetical protein
VGFEPTIPVLERAKTVHATVIGDIHNYDIKRIVSLHSSVIESSDANSPSPSVSDNGGCVVVTSGLYTIGQI